MPNRTSPWTDAQHLLEDLADAVRVHERDIIEQKIEIEAEEVRERTGRAHAEYVDAVRPRERVDSALKASRSISSSVWWIMSVSACSTVRSTSRPPSRSLDDLHALHRGQLVADHLLKSALKVGVAVVAQLGRKAHDRGLAHAHRYAQTARRHEGRLVVVL